MRINKYFPFAIIYFFLNSFALPFGLTYTAILSPFFYWWILKTRKQDVLLPFFLILFPFIYVHVNLVEVDISAYIISLLNLTAVYIYCQAFYTFLKQNADHEKIWKRLLIINFALCLIAIPFYFTSYADIFWIRQFLTRGVSDFKRLKLFTYEASYYATLLVPIFFFYFLQILLRQNKVNAWLLFIMILLPYVLSFSLGVISCIIIATGVVYVLYFKRLMRKKRVVHLLGLAAIAIIPLFFIVLFWGSDTVLFLRLQNIFEGKDTSGRGRTFEAFTLAYQMMDLKSHFWGIGLGQIKVIGSDIIRDYYLYPANFKNVALPNATAETLAIFGWLGCILRILIEVILFFYTKVWTNYYRLLLFLFIFLYQFTGSFITNVAEYVIWILAFTEVYPQFQVAPVKKSVVAAIV